VILPDLNILLHAVNLSSARHSICAGWLEESLSGGKDTIGIPWIVRLGFLRIATSMKVFETPLTVAAASEWLDGITTRPRVVPLEPGPSHMALLRHLLLDTGTGGNLVSDAHLAALALEHDALIVTGDRDFARFPGLKVEVLY
jgi:uncharacterized protein